MSIVKKIFEIEKVRERFKDNYDLYFRLAYMLFVFNKNRDMTKYVLSLLKISPEIIIKTLDHRIKPPQQEVVSNNFRLQFHRERIIQQLVRYNSLQDLKFLIEIITEKEFIKQVFINDDYNINVLEQGIFWFFSLCSFCF